MNKKLFDIVSIPIDDVYPDEMQPRAEMRRIDELAADIATFGQLDPIIVRQDGGIYKILSGERRWTAMKKNGDTEIAARIATNPEEEDILIALAANHSDPLTPEELSRGYQRSFALDVPVEKIAAATGEDIDRLKAASAGYRVASAFYGSEPEPTSIERFIALHDFAGDKEAEDAILRAPESEWRGVASRLARERKMDEETAEARGWLATRGIEVVDTAPGLSFLAAQRVQKLDAPEGTTCAVIARRYDFIEVMFYGERAGVSPEESAAREQAARLHAEMEEASARRLAFIAERLDVPERFAGAKLMSFALDQWKDGIVADAEEVGEEFEALDGYRLMLASVLARVESYARLAFGGGYYRDRHGGRALAYLDVLLAEGYEPGEAEAAVIADLREVAK